MPSNSSYYHHHTIPHQAVIQCLVVVVCLPLRIDCDKVGDKSSVVPYHISRPLPLLEAPGGPPKDYQTHGRSTVAAAAQPLILIPSEGIEIISDPAKNCNFYWFPSLLHNLPPSHTSTTTHFEDGIPGPLDVPDAGNGRATN